MNSPPEGATAIVLAGQRAGVTDPLAAAAGVSHKCLVPVAGRPMLVHPVAALAAALEIARLRIVVEPEAADAVLRALPPSRLTPEVVPAADNLADSVLRATADLEGPVVVTTADNVLLRPTAVAAVLAAAREGADAAVAMARREAVLAAHPDGQRRFYRFRDDHYSNCNLYGFAGRRAFRAAETFRSGGQFAKKPLRLIGAIGPVTLALLLLGRLTLDEAARRMSRRLGIAVAPVVLDDGANAIDVDNERTLRVATELLARRAVEAGAEADLAA